MSFLNGIDANYVPLMENLGIRWFDEKGKVIDEIYSYFASKGINSARIRLWVGKEGPSKLYYVERIAKRALEAKMSIYLVLFLSDGWADLYKQLVQTNG